MIKSCTVVKDFYNYKTAPLYVEIITSRPMDTSNLKYAVQKTNKMHSNVSAKEQMNVEK